jgi:hypothetical protein
VHEAFDVVARDRLDVYRSEQGMMRRVIRPRSEFSVDAFLAAFRLVHAHLIGRRSLFPKPKAIDADIGDLLIGEVTTLSISARRRVRSLASSMKSWLADR